MWQERQLQQVRRCNNVSQTISPLTSSFRSLRERDLKKYILTDHRLWSDLEETALRCIPIWALTEKTKSTESFVVLFINLFWRTGLYKRVKIKPCSRNNRPSWHRRQIIKTYWSRGSFRKPIISWSLNISLIIQNKWYCRLKFLLFGFGLTCHV